MKQHFRRGWLLKGHLFVSIYLFIYYVFNRHPKTEPDKVHEKKLTFNNELACILRKNHLNIIEYTQAKNPRPGKILK